MTCDDVRALLPDFVLGSPSDADDFEVRRHLRGCQRAAASWRRSTTG